MYIYILLGYPTGSHDLAATFLGCTSKHIDITKISSMFVHRAAITNVLHSWALGTLQNFDMAQQIR